MKTTLLAAALAVVGAASPAPVLAQSYPIDCAILLCLAGGWPASVPCARARAEFIRRITPWPVEPPLQIWNCPMHASYEVGPSEPQPARLYDAALPQWSLPDRTDLLAEQIPSTPSPDTPAPVPAVLSRGGDVRERFLRLAQAVGAGADIDISGPEFDFVRSIKVWHVEYRHIDARNNGCVEYDRALLGSYGTQGDYRWKRSSAHAAPGWMGIDLTCRRGPVPLYRAVGVEWLDHQGNPGHELVRY